MKKLRVGVIGVGNMGKNHARVYSEIANLVAIADTSEITKSKIGKYSNAIFYKDYKQMLKENSLDAVSVAVPTLLHKEIVTYCLEQKIPTLVEKPIASNLSEAQEMFKTAKRFNTFLMVGHVERFNPAVVKLKTIINQGRLGKIISLLAVRVGISPPNPAASDVAVDLGIHDVDVFNYLLNGFPDKRKIIKTKLFSKNIADSSILLLEYGKIIATIQTNWITPVKTRKLYVSGVEGYAELDYIQQKLVLHDKILNTKFDGSYYELLSLSDSSKKEVFISKKEPLKEELLYFLSNKNNWQANNIKESIEALKIVK